MIENKNRNEVSQLGKFGLIHNLSQKFTKHHSSSFGMDEDASVLKAGSKNVLFSSRLFIENIHFDLSYFPLKHLGYKCVTVALSDLLAMNGKPSHIRVNLAISNRFSMEAMEELTAGMSFCCDRYKIDLLGLDVTASPTGLTISVEAVGEVADNSLLKRSGAKEKELLCVSGDFGSAYAGLILLEREKKVFEANPNAQPDLTGYDYLLERQLKPEPRFDIIEALEEAKIKPTSMINVTDGLATSLIQLCEASHVGCQVYESKIPIDLVTFNTLKELKIVGTMVALNGGEDYELLFTIKQEDFEKIQKIETISVIGYIQEESAGKNLITNDDRLIELKAQGFEKAE